MRKQEQPKNITELRRPLIRYAGYDAAERMKVNPLPRGLTQTQQACLTALRTFYQGFGRSPTYRQLATAMGLKATSQGTVHRIVEQLEAKGYVTRHTGAWNAIIPVSDKCPTCGRKN